MFLSLLVRLQLALTAFLTGMLAGARTRAMSPARGANFIEYAMLAVIAIGLGWIFRTQLSTAFNGILEQVRNGIGAGGSANTNS